MDGKLFEQLPRRAVEWAEIDVGDVIAYQTESMATELVGRVRARGECILKVGTHILTDNDYVRLLLTHEEFAAIEPLGPRQLKSCARCGAVFQPTASRQIYCTKECNVAVQGERQCAVRRGEDPGPPPSKKEQAQPPATPEPGPGGTDPVLGPIIVRAQAALEKADMARRMLQRIDQVAAAIAAKVQELELLTRQWDALLRAPGTEEK